MKSGFLFAIVFFISYIGCCQGITILAGDTSNLSGYHIFDIPVHIERIGTGNPVAYYLDIDNNGKNDLRFECGNSFGAMGYASNYITVRALDFNEVCYATVDSSYCFNGYKPVFFAGLSEAGEAINDQLTYSGQEMVINKELWFMGDTCSILVQNVGEKYLAVKLNSHGMNGLAWVELGINTKSINGYSVDVKATGYKTLTNSVAETTNPLVAVYPNPAFEILKIRSSGLSGSTVFHICDLTGREIIRLNNDSPEQQVKLSKGTYILKVTDRHQSKLVRKIIVF